MITEEETPTAPGSEYPDEQFSDPYSFCNGCGKAGCPAIETTGDGVAISDPDVAGGAAIEFDAEQARALRRWLQQRGF